MSGPESLGGKRRRIAGLSLAFGLVGALLAGALIGWTVDEGPSPALVATAAAALVAIFALMLVYWRNIDELAQAAHKSAWFWGGSAGLVAAVILIALLGEQPGWFGLDAALSEREAGLVQLTALLALAPPLVGYGLYWAAFWLWKR